MEKKNGTKLEEFGKLFMKAVRDETINSIDKMLDGTMKGITSRQVQEKFADFDSKQIEVVKWFLPKIIDMSLHNMLFMIEVQDEIELLFKKENLNDLSDGLSGELYTEDGWIKNYSKERE